MVVHAAANSSSGTTSQTRAVVLTADEAQLVRLADELAFEGVPHVAFRENESPYNGALMSIGIEPVEDRRMVRRFLKGLLLLE